MKIVYKAAETLCKIFLALQVVVVTYIVVDRFLLNKSPGWGEEFSLLCMVWFSLLSISVGVFNDTHIVIPLLNTLMPKKILKYLNLLNHVLAIGFALCMIVSGIFVTILNSANVMPGMDIPSTWLYLSIPVSGVFLLLSLIAKTRDIL